VFDRCGALSPSFWWDERELLERVREGGSTADDLGLRIYLDSGDSGPSSDGMADTAEMRDVLIEKGFVLEETLRYVLGVGDTHTESAWRSRAPGALGFLYRDPDRALE
jgi:predicted alpha/beta superfamily hydrolase